MFALKGGFLVLGVFAISVIANRIIRSPDKMEINIPNQTYERESGEYQADMNEEAAYWHGQGDKLGDKAGEGQGQLEEDRDKNQENYEHEKEHIEEQQQDYNNEMNTTYQEDRNRTEAHHEANQEHYSPNLNDTNYEYQGNMTADNLTETETGDRYGEKGNEYVNDGEDKVENYNIEDNAPSISYTRD